MRVALSRQDVGTVYRLLQATGYSQHLIAELVGQSQPEVSQITHGRQVRAYDVLVRIALGLGIPPGYLGLAWCTHNDCPPPVRPAAHPTAGSRGC
jgi:transcriptional regulator with XRE-family HTH domain